MDKKELTKEEQAYLAASYIGSCDPDIISKILASMEEEAVKAGKSLADRCLP